MIELFDEQCAKLMAEILIMNFVSFTMEHIKRNGINGYRFSWSQDTK